MNIKLFSLPLNIQRYQWYLYEQHSESFTIWSALIRIKREGKSLILNSRTGRLKVISRF